MTISIVKVNPSNAPLYADGFAGGTGGTMDLGTLTLNSLVVVVLNVYNTTGTTATAGMLTKDSGTSAISTPTLDVQQVANAQTPTRTITYSFRVTTGGTCVLRWTPGSGAGTSYITAGFVEASGNWDESRLDGTTGSAAGSSAAADSGSKTSAAAALMVGGYADTAGSAYTITEDASWTIVTEDQTDAGSHQRGAVAYRNVSSSTSDSASWTISSSVAWGASIALYKEAAGGSNTTITPGNGAPSLTGYAPSRLTHTHARPTSDVSEGWTLSTGVDSWALLDEASYNDSDYIYTTAASQTTEVLLATLTPPVAGTDLYIDYRVQGVTGGATVTVSLRQGAGTNIKTDTTRSANGDYTMTVTSAEWASVSDWSDLRLRFVSG